MRARSPAAGPSRAPRARRRSWLLPNGLEALDPDREPDRADRLRGAEPRQQGVVAAARDELRRDAPLGIMNFEYEAGVIIDAAAERGREVRARDIDSLCGQKSGATFEKINGRTERDAAFLGKRAQLGGGRVRIAGDVQEALDHYSGRFGQARAAAERRLFEKAVGDLPDSAPAHGGDAGNRQEIGDERVRGAKILAGERGEQALVLGAALCGTEAQPVEILRQTSGAVEILGEATAPGRRQIERFDQRRE